MVTVTIFNAFKKGINGAVDWEGDDIKIMLLDGTVPPDIDLHEMLSDLDANEIAGTGYAAGGEDLTGRVVTVDNVNDLSHYDADDVAWPGATFTGARYGLIYKDTTDRLTSPLICVVDFDGDKEVTDGTFTIQWHANGVFTLE